MTVAKKTVAAKKAAAGFTYKGILYQEPEERNANNNRNYPGSSVTNTLND